MVLLLILKTVVDGSVIEAYSSADDGVITEGYDTALDVSLLSYSSLSAASEHREPKDTRAFAEYKKLVKIQ
ncbi:hypothetical protein SK128_023474, partial [Halocaridina rubra]